MEMKMLSHAELVNKIKQYLETEIPEREYEILDHNLAAEEPTLGIQTCMRIIGIAVTPTGEVVSDYSVKLGLGTEKDFENRAVAIKALRKAVSRAYSDAENIKEDFMSSTITLDKGEKHVILTSDYSGKVTELVEARQAEEKPAEKPKKKRAKKVSDEEAGQMSLTDFMAPEDKKEETPKKGAAKKTSTKEVEKETVKPAVVKPAQAPVQEEIKVEDLVFTSKEYTAWPEGLKVCNIYNRSKVYSVIEDLGNIIKVKDDTSGNFNVARSDLEIVAEEE